MISVSHLTKRYGPTLAVNDLSFDVGKGEVLGFLGPNGAGKSTTLRILSGFLAMTGGKVTVAGYDIVEDTFEARKRIGYMPEAVPLYPEMRAIEYLTFRAELKRVPRAERRKAVEDAMEKARITDVATRLIGHLSKGYRQRVGLADALVARPAILILDEPTAGLDPNQIREVRTAIRELAKEQTVLLSTHILSEVESSCSRVVLIAKGKLAAEGTIDELRAMRRSSGVDLTVRGDAGAAEQALRKVNGVAKVERQPGESDVTTVRVLWAKGLARDDVACATEASVAALVSGGLHVREVKATGSSLEDVFASLTRDAEPEGGAGERSATA
jgi:ABC-2 type transport system ATP-binding protein